MTSVSTKPAIIVPEIESNGFFILTLFYMIDGMSKYLYCVLLVIEQLFLSIIFYQ